MVGSHLGGALQRCNAPPALVRSSCERPAGGEHLARCRLRISGGIADLDYATHAAFNRARGMDLGVMRLRFADNLRRSLVSVGWKDPGSTVFRATDVQITYEDAHAGRLEKLYEGALRRMLRSSFVRSLRARRICIETHGAACVICGFDFGRTYGHIADGYIHVHHVRALSVRRKRHAVDPATDLLPLCANCHAAVHLRRPEFSLDDVRNLMAAAAKGRPPNKRLQPPATQKRERRG